MSAEEVSYPLSIHSKVQRLLGGTRIEINIHFLFHCYRSLLNYSLNYFSETLRCPRIYTPRRYAYNFKLGRFYLIFFFFDAWRKHSAERKDTTVFVSRRNVKYSIETIIDDHIRSYHMWISRCELDYPSLNYPVFHYVEKCYSLYGFDSLFCWWLNNECLDHRTMVNAIRAAIIVSFNEQFMCFNCFEGWWTWLWNDSLMKRIRLVCFILWTIVGKKSRVELEGCRWNEKIKRWNRQGIRPIVQMKFH